MSILDSRWEEARRRRAEQFAAAAIAQREIAMRRECNALAMMLSLNFVADLINMNTRFLQGRIAGASLFMQVGLMLAAMLALVTFLYWVIDPPQAHDGAAGILVGTAARKRDSRFPLATSFYRLSLSIHGGDILFLSQR